MDNQNISDPPPPTVCYHLIAHKRLGHQHMLGEGSGGVWVWEGFGVREEMGWGVGGGY